MNRNTFLIPIKTNSKLSFWFQNTLSFHNQKQNSAELKWLSILPSHLFFILFCFCLDVMGVPAVPLYFYISVSCALKSDSFIHCMKLSLIYPKQSFVSECNVLGWFGFVMYAWHVCHNICILFLNLIFTPFLWSMLICMDFGFCNYWVSVLVFAFSVHGSCFVEPDTLFWVNSFPLWTCLYVYGIGSYTAIVFICFAVHFALQTPAFDYVSIGWSNLGSCFRVC